MSEYTNECVIEWIPGRDYVGVTAKNGSSWKNRCEELEKGISRRCENSCQK